MSKKVKKVKKVAVWVKNYGNDVVVMRFNPYSMTFNEIRVNGTREDKINRLMKWYDKDTATQITEDSLKKYIAITIGI